MPLQISIPTPCHEDWNEMTPADKGRHCNHCSKTVVDFTQSKPQEILFYLNQHTSEKLCGRFNPEQIEEPVPTPEDFVKQLNYFRMPLLRKIAAIFLFAFSVMAVSCNDHLTGKVVKNDPAQADSSRIRKDSSQSRIDTVLTGEPTMGLIAPPLPPPPAKPKPVKVVCTPQPPPQIMGDMIMVPVPDSIKEIAVQDLKPDIVPDKPVIMGKIKAP
jgi:hypothetical protein